MDKNNRKKQLKNYARFSGIALQMGATIYLGSLLGKWLDGKFPNENELYTKIVTLTAVFLAMYSVIKQVTNISNKK
ncbi:AtpZ/AtpI family protein [Pseudofulvibacter geojedonensis]|uniref:AtpZ/AtpI family protein n=1 Tax=Pseudofulvibacter geojedonensis TaxID=1123758 RepID=A0ABW3I3Y4_9FLAO